MPQITWKTVGDLDFSDSNDLRVKGSEMMADGARTIVDTFKEIATKNAVVQKEERDLKFAGAIQNMSLAQNEDQLRASYGTALSVDGIGADNVLKLSDTYKGYQKGILNLQGQRLGNTGQGLVNTGRQQNIDYTKQTQPTKVQADNAVNKGVIDTIQGKVSATNSSNDLAVKSNDYKELVLDNKTKANLPFLQAQQDSISSQYRTRETQAKARAGLPESDVASSIAKNSATRSNSSYTVSTNVANTRAGLPYSNATTKKVQNDLSTTKNRQGKQILDQTESATIGTAVNQSKTNLVQSTVASNNSYNNAQLEQDTNTAKLKSETAKFDSQNESYYTNKRKSESNKLRDQDELRKAKIEASKYKTVESREKVKALESKVQRRQAIANTVNEAIVSSGRDKTLTPTKLYQRALKSLKNKGKALTPEESLNMFSHFTKVTKFEGRQVSTLKDTASSFASKDSVTKKYYDNLNSKDVSVVDTVMASLKASGSVIDGGIVKRIPPRYHKDYMKGLIEFMSRHTDKFSPLTWNTTNAAEGYASYNRKYFNKTVNETNNPINTEER